MKTLTDKNVDFCWPSKSYFYWLNKNSRGHGIFRIMVEKETNICNENWWPHFTNISTRNGFLRIQSNTETWKEFKFRNKNTFLRNVTRDATLLFIDSPLNNLCVNNKHSFDKSMNMVVILDILFKYAIMKISLSSVCFYWSCRWWKWILPAFNFLM
jgi:hypothetical protein